MAIVWMVRYEYGRLKLQGFDVVRASGKQIVLKDGGAASGYRSRVPASEVFWTEREAWQKAEKLVSDAIEATNKALSDHKAWLRDVRARLGTP